MITISTTTLINYALVRLQHVTIATFSSVAGVQDPEQVGGARPSW